MTAQRTPTPRKAKVEIRTITEEEEFLSRNVGNIRTQRRQRLSDDDVSESGVLTTHTRPGTVLMWKPGIDGRYVPRTVSETSKALNFDNGWLSKCPDCGTNHEASDLPPSDPNSCPGRDKIAVRICPVAGCGKRILDNQAQNAANLEELIAESEDSEMIIRDDAQLKNTTPAGRTLVGWHIHMWERHPRQAQMRGIPPLSQEWLNPRLPIDDTVRPL